MIEQYQISAEADYYTNTVFINNQEAIKLTMHGVNINFDLLGELVDAYRSGLYEVGGIKNER